MVSGEVVSGEFGGGLLTMAVANVDVAEVLLPERGVARW
jgi:hypothetical protein